MNKFSMKRKGGFTLVEIMIVVLIIGILLAIAVPNFMKARETSRTKTCVSNLKQIDAAKDQYAMEEKLTTDDAIPDGALWAAGGYMKAAPLCPTAGDYTVNAVGTDPACSKGAPHAL